MNTLGNYIWSNKMKTYKEKIKELQEEQHNDPDWCGTTDVEMAREIYASLESYLQDDPGEDCAVWTIAKTIRQHRSY